MTKMEFVSIVIMNKYPYLVYLSAGTSAAYCSMCNDVVI